VAAGQIDCGLGVFAAGAEGLRYAPVIEERLLLIGAKGHPLMSQPQVRWAELRGQPLAAIKAPADIRRELDSQLRLAGIADPPLVEVRQMLTLLGMVSAGLGLAVWPSWATGLLDPFGVRARPLVDPVARLQVSVITPTTRQLSPAATSFLTVLTDGAHEVAAAVERAMPGGPKPERS
jgi:DNA-binding transcriptional LysR family regulator